MPKTKEILERIQSITASQQITQATKMVAVAKLGKTKKKVAKLFSYSKQLVEIFEQVAFSRKKLLVSPYFVQRAIEQVLIIFVATNKGFCGALNTHILKQVADCHSQYVAQDKRVNFLPIGKKGMSFLEKNGFFYTTAYMDFGENANLEQTERLSEFVIQAFEKNKYDRVVMIYQSSGVAGKDTVVTKQLLPILPSTSILPQKAPINFVYEPSKQAVIDYLLPKVVKLQLHQMLLVASIAEQMARMMAMGKATDNADALLKDFRLTYNRTRQAAVTRQIIEIAAGVEALK